jgi:ABC-2 type transport system ATP-binding protein
MSVLALSFEGVSRSFGRKVALEDVSLRVEPGSVLGLVGSNGAGKTTALRLAHGLLYPDAGRIRTLGLDPAKDGREVRTRVSLLSEESSLYPWMRISEIVRFAAAIHPRFDRDHAESLRKRLDLDPQAKIGTLSRGTRAKVALVLAVAARPDLLLLDDPTAGLDPLVRREVLEGILDAVPAEGGAVVYASHLVHDVERVADRIAVMDRGRIRLDEPLEELKARMRRATAVFEGDAPSASTIPGCVSSRSEGRVLTVVSDAANGSLASALQALGASSVEVESLNLEDILVALLERGSVKEVQHA